jgi:hypothetical protein
MTGAFSSSSSSSAAASSGRRAPVPTLEDPAAEARRVLDLAAEANVDIRVIGGVAVRLRCPSTREEPLARSYRDIDYAIRAADVRQVTELFTFAGYQPDGEFNALHSRQRLCFWDPAREREADVFVDSFAMCHTFDFRRRLTIDRHTLPLADLLLFKLQVVETNDKDYKDAVALLADHTTQADGLNAQWIAQFLARDWGWWRTVTMLLDRVDTYAEHLPLFEGAAIVRHNIRALREVIEQEPKSRRWKIRSRMGERIRWYEIPEETHP